MCINIAAACIKSVFILAKLKPDALFSKGGFVTVPPVLAARILGIPVISHESDFDPGLATKINSKSSVRICVPYLETKEFFTPSMQARVCHTGNPVRKDIFEGRASEARRILGVDDNKTILFVQGGSLGARQINETLRAVLPVLMEQGWFVVHQRGNDPWDVENVPGKYLSMNFFSAEYAHILAASTLVFSRAGAGSIWEMGVMKKPAILLPLDGGSRGDQVRNADFCAKAGAAVVLPQLESAKVLGEFLNRVSRAADPEQGLLSAMSAAWEKVVVSDGALRVATVIKEVLDARA